jgi:hypothetical protein
LKTVPKAAIAISSSTDSFTAGSEASRSALDQLGSDQDVHLAIVFCTSSLEAEALTKGIRSVLGPTVLLFGANANGVISNHFIGYDGFYFGLALLHLPGINVKLFSYTGIAFNEAVAGNILGSLIAPELPDQQENPCLLFLYDSVNRQKKRFTMNLATPLIDGLNKYLPISLPIAGSRVMGDMKFNPTSQWCGQDLLKDSAVALLLSGNLRVYTKVLHGCRPTSAYHRITKADGPVVLEIDERPALDLIGDILGPQLRNDYQQYKFFVTFGVNYGEKWGAFNEDQYANRMCVNVDRNRAGLVLAEPLAEGTEFQLMRRSFDMDQYRTDTSSLLDEISSDNFVPFFALYLNCAGRAATYYGSEEEEAAYVAQGLNNRVPLLGVYEAGEITRIKQDLKLLDWSGVLLIFSYPL